MSASSRILIACMNLPCIKTLSTCSSGILLISKSLTILWSPISTSGSCLVAYFDSFTAFPGSRWFYWIFLRAGNDYADCVSPFRGIFLSIADNRNFSFAWLIYSSNFPPYLFALFKFPKLSLLSPMLLTWVVDDSLGGCIGKLSLFYPILMGTLP